MADQIQEFDLVIIGAGSGGSPLASRAVGYGASVCVIDRGHRYEGKVRIGAGFGGTCVNVGCIPKKMMFTAAMHRELFEGPAATAAKNGFSIEGKLRFDWATLKANRDAYINRINKNKVPRWENLVKKTNGRVLVGSGAFVDTNTVAVTGTDGKVINVKGKHIVIATGGRPVFPPNTPGAEEHGYSSDNFFDIETQPKKAAVIGAGYIAVEMAGIMHALGTDTTLICRGATVLRRGFDPFIVNSLMTELHKHGPHMQTESTVAKVEEAPDGTKTLTLTSGKVLSGFDLVLFAVGRKPNTVGIGLGKAGVQLDKRGFIVVDKFENTTVPGIYALGDVTNTGYELTPVAIAAARRLADRLFGGLKEARILYENIPTVVFSHPPLGVVGLTEPQAREKYGDKQVRVLENTFVNEDYNIIFAMGADRPKCAFKLVLVGEEEKVVGIHTMGGHCDEILQGFGVAMKMGATRRDLESCMAIHPVAAEELVTFSGWGQNKDGKPVMNSDVLRADAEEASAQRDTKTNTQPAAAAASSSIAGSGASAASALSGNSS